MRPIKTFGTDSFRQPPPDSTTDQGTRHRPAGWRTSLLAAAMALLGLSTFVAVAATPASAAQGFVNARVASAGVAEVGTRRTTGWNQPGECLMSARRWVAAAGGYFGGGGVSSGYINSGAQEVSLSQVVKGDVLQRTDGNDGDWSQAHTVVVVAVLGGGRFSIVQSNAPGYVNGVWRNDYTGLVTQVFNWSPTGPSGWYWRAWRFGTPIGAVVGLAGKCVDVRYGQTSNGTAVQLYDCNGTGAQSWTAGADGTIRAFGKCMDVTWGGRANGTRIQLYDCNGTGAQVWRWSGLALVNPQSGRCLDVPGANSANWTQLQIYDCNGTAAQQWRIG
jgi:hypothetical protein